MPLQALECESGDAPRLGQLTSDTTISAAQSLVTVPTTRAQRLCLVVEVTWKQP